MTPDEIYAMCRTDEGRDEYCRQFKTDRWLVKKSPAAVEVHGPVALWTPDSGARFRMVAGLEHGGNFDCVHVAEIHAEEMARDTPEDWYIVDDRDVAELDRMYRVDSGVEVTTEVSITFGPIK